MEEWSSDFENSFCNFVPSEVDIEHAEWTFEENKLFENALAEFDPASPGFFENVASRVPRKSIEQIKKHHQDLVEDVEMIEAGRIPIPNHETCDDDQHQQRHRQQEQENKKEKELVTTTDQQAKKDTAGHHRRRGVPWTEEEHQLFLMGLNKYGKGDWRSISRYYVITKTPTQVASHAQKYFRRQNSSTPPDRRRPSIHDIQTVNPTFISMSQSSFPCTIEDQMLLPSFHHPYNNNNAMNPSMFYNSFHGGPGEFGGFANDQTAIYSSSSSMSIYSSSSSMSSSATFSSMVNNPMMMMNQQPPSDASFPSSSSSSLQPSPWNNQYWG